MAIRGSCLCGSIRFEIDAAAGPFEICHCRRCRKVTGSGGMPALEVDPSAFRFLEGEHLISRYEAPILYRPPAYVVTFCSRCGSPVPCREPDSDRLGIPAGLFDDDPGVRPDKHIYIEYRPGWDTSCDELPAYTREGIYELRTGKSWPG